MKSVLRFSIGIVTVTALASAAYLYARSGKTGGRRTRRSYGSQTNASDAVDDIELRPDAAPDEVLDVGVQHTFPASDPVAVQDAYETADERQRRRRSS
jgi:hypothetical protein